MLSFLDRYVFSFYATFVSLKAYLFHFSRITLNRSSGNVEQKHIGLAADFSENVTISLSRIVFAAGF